MDDLFCIFDVSDPVVPRMKVPLFANLSEAADEANTLLVEYPQNDYKIMKITEVQASDWPDGDAT